MKKKTWRRKFGGFIAIIAVAAIALGLIVAAPGYAAEKPAIMNHAILNQVHTTSLPESEPGSNVNFTLKSLLEVPVELFDLQHMRDAEDRVDRRA